MYEIYDGEHRLIFLAENIKANHYSTRFEDRRTPFKAVLINETRKPVLSVKQFGSALFGEQIVVKKVMGM